MIHSHAVLINISLHHSIPQYITVYYSTSQYITVYHSISQYITVYHSIPKYIAVHITVYHSIPQYITVHITVYHGISYLSSCRPMFLPHVEHLEKFMEINVDDFLNLLTPLYFNSLCILPLQCSLYICSYAMLFMYIKLRFVHQWCLFNSPSTP